MFVRKPTLLHCITGQLALQCLCSARDAFVVACVTVFIGLVLRGTRFTSSLTGWTAQAPPVKHLRGTQRQFWHFLTDLLLTF